ncbi:MAG: hypothetical protein LBG45_04215 [Dysgonamonadaceae bacterium]|nr:hypothetical protein [Dysgonamonadaceae bacterium]
MHTLSIEPHRENIPKSISINIKVEIYTLPEKLYQNLHSQEPAIGPSGDIFSEPVKIYTYTQTDRAYLAFIISVKKKNWWRQKGNNRSCDNVATI